jgi:probable phosphoglycerate mutase
MTRRRLYLMRHAEVAYFDADGRPVAPGQVLLTPEGEEQARAASEALAGVQFDRVLTSGLRRTVDTARIVAPAVEPEEWPELRELEPGKLREISDDDLETTFAGAFRGAIPPETPFLGGETIGSLFDRVIPALERLLDDPAWDAVLAVLHSGVNRAILSYALTGERRFFGGFEQAPACVNIVDIGDDWIVRAVNHTPYDPVHARGRRTTMEELYELYLPYRKARRT